MSSCSGEENTELEATGGFSFSFTRFFTTSYLSDSLCSIANPPQAFSISFFSIFILDLFLGLLYLLLLLLLLYFFSPSPLTTNEIKTSWLSLSQVKEMGVLALNSTHSIAADATALFESWIAFASLQEDDDDGGTTATSTSSTSVGVTTAAAVVRQNPALGLFMKVCGDCDS